MGLHQERIGKWARSSREVSESVPSYGGGANENLRQCERAGSGVGTWSHGAVSLIKASGEQGTDSTATSSVRELRKQVRDFETPAGGEDSGSGFSKVPCTPMNFPR